MKDDEPSSASPTDSVDAEPPAEARVALGAGTGDDLLLSNREIDAILSARRSKFIVVVGGVESGKTSLLASVFHGLLGGEFAGQRFEHSSSLPALSRMLWYITVQSRQSQPNLPRTVRVEGYAGVHLRLREADRSQDLVFSDVSGEIFDEARRSPEGAEQSSYIARADAVALLIDGAKVAEPGLRDVEYNDLSTVVKRLQDCGYLKSSVPLAVVFTKIDLWRSSPEVCSIVDHFFEKLVKDRALTNARRIDTASLSNLKDLPSGTGVADFLRFVLEADHYSAPRLAPRSAIDFTILPRYLQLGMRSE
jgi:hypothetical protein